MVDLFQVPRLRRLPALMESVQPVAFVRLPNAAWLDFVTGDLTADDWALIERVERGEVSVDDAMAARVRAERAGR